VALTNAEKAAQEQLIQKIKEAEAAKQAAQLAAEQVAFSQTKAAEASKQAAELHAQELLTLAEARQEASGKDASATKVLAEAEAARSAAIGLGEAQVLVAKAEASQKQGQVDAEVAQLKLAAEADGITKKAAAMKLLENAGREHEEFKLQLEKQKAVELAQINIQKDIAAAQAGVLGEAMKSAKIEIVGGETQFFDKITNAIGTGRALDRMVEGSRTLTDIKETFFNGDPEYFKAQVRQLVDQFGVTSDDLKNLTVATLIGRLVGLNPDSGTLNKLTGMLGAATRFGLADQSASALLAAKAVKK
jgi:flotillin